jgi:phosphate transport system substrate-binding protein
MPITVARRSDGSGTTAIFSDYLSKVSKEWESKVGHGKSLNWPVGLGGKGNEGVTAVIKQTPGAIGYIEMIYAIQNKLPMAALKNLSGQFVIPSLESTSEAAKINIPTDTRVSITNSKTGYPISGFTWILVYKDQNYNNRSLNQAKALSALLKWMLTEGQGFAKPLGYSPLSKEVQVKAMTLVKTLNFNAKPIH